MLGVSGGGDTPESAVDALYSAMGMDFRTGVKKYIILLTDADYKDGIVGNSSITMEDAIDELLNRNIVTSVITETYYKPTYTSLVTKTNGVFANINENFADALEPLVEMMGEQVNDGCWVRLSNGTLVCLEKNPLLEDISVDTDGDGIPDIEELLDVEIITILNPINNKEIQLQSWTFQSDPSKIDTDEDGIGDKEDSFPTEYDIVPVDYNGFYIRFNTGRTWFINKYTANEIWEAHNRLREVEYDTNRNAGNAQEIIDWSAYIINDNDLIDFSMEELMVISLLDADGIRFYLDSKPISLREDLFERMYGRNTDYYQQQGLFNRRWEKVSGYADNAWYKGKVLSEADVVYSFEQLRVRDIYTLIDFVTITGLIVITSFVFAYTGVYVSANIQAFAAYTQTYGLKLGTNMYLSLGAANAPVVQNSIINAVSQEIMDGDDTEYRLIDYADDTIKVNQDVWKLGDAVRGDILDDLDGNNLGHNFPVADKLVNRVLTSTKSIDPSGSSYQGIGGLFSKISKDAQKLYNFSGRNWGGVRVQPSQYDSKVLHVIFPDTVLSYEQMLSLQIAELYIENEYGIRLLISVTEVVK